jgi:hypothetical protein
MVQELVADRQGFEPWIPCGIHAFQACAFSHSAICPHRSLGNFLRLPQSVGELGRPPGSFRQSPHNIAVRPAPGL